MKRVIFNVIACVCLLGFVSCGDKNEDPTPQEKKAESVIYEFNYKLSKSTLDVADITFTYLDESGKSQTEKITNEKWSKELVFKTFPANVELKAEYKLKEGLIKDTYNLSYFPQRGYKVIYNTGDAISKEEGSFQETNGLKRENLDEFLTQRIMKAFSQKVTFKKAADGSIVIE